MILPTFEQVFRGDKSQEEWENNIRGIITSLRPYMMEKEIFKSIMNSGRGSLNPIEVRRLLNERKP